MRTISVIFKREFLAYFNSPIAYVFLIVFLGVTGLLFTANFFFSVAEMRFLFNILPIALAVFMPAVTMRMWAEERRTGTIGLLLSLPAKNYELVLGKFLASLVFYLIAIAGTMTIPIMLALAGEPDIGPIAGGYIGAVLLGAFFLSIGLFVSVLFKDQILAFIVAMVLCFGFYLLGTEFVAIPLDGWTGSMGTVIRDVVGAANRLESAQRGILDIGDVVYFLAFGAGFLLLNVYALESRIRMHGASLFPAGVALVIAIAAVISMVAGEMRLPRFDLTEDGIHSLAPATGRILSSLKAPVKVRYYVTPREHMPTYLNMKNLERDVRDRLEEFAEYSPSFTYEVVDPTADVETREKLQQRGIVPFTAQSIQKDAREVKLVYSAISISYLDKKEEILPRLIPNMLGQLEYELISRIYRMTLEEKPTVAVFAPLQYRDPNMRDEAYRRMMAMRGFPVQPPEDRFTLVKQVLRHEGYEVAAVTLGKGSEIPEKAKALLVIAPENLKPEQVKKIENFVAAGGNLFVAVQKHSFAYMPEPGGGWRVKPSKADTGVEPLLRKFGVAIDEAILMDKSSAMVGMTRTFGNLPFPVREDVRHPVQIMVVQENMNKEMGITDRLSGLAYFWGSALTIDQKAAGKAGRKARTLFTTSALTWTIPSKTTPLTREDADPKTHKKVGKRPLAFYITCPPPGGRDKGKTVKVIVVGCAEMFSDSLLRGLSDKTFLLNSVDALSLGEDLGSVRSKGTLVRVIASESLTDGEKLFYRFLTLGLMPVVFAVLGIVRSVVRRRRRAAYLRKYL
jgi:ABC-type uncharacterized transport system involved in gliding motility auxiliary subunit